jgi:hypothetical protein
MSKKKPGTRRELRRADEALTRHGLKTTNKRARQGMLHLITHSNSG